jgi:hypothetical protein
MYLSFLLNKDNFCNKWDFELNCTVHNFLLTIQPTAHNIMPVTQPTVQNIMLLTQPTVQNNVTDWTEGTQ